MSNTSTHQEVTGLLSVHIANVTRGRLEAGMSGSYQHKQCMQLELPTNWTKNTGHPSLLFPPLPFSSPFLPPLPPLRSRTLKSSYGVWGRAVSSPAGSGAQPQPKLNLMHFSSKIWHLVATILMIFLRINLPCFNMEAKMLWSCIHLLHYFNTICPPSTAENGTFDVPGRPRPERGTMKQKYGTSREIRGGWQP